MKEKKSPEKQIHNKQTAAARKGTSAKEAVPARADRFIILVYLLWETINLIAIKYAESHLALPAQRRVMFTAICINTLLVLYFYLKRRPHAPSGGIFRQEYLFAGLLLTFFADLFLTLCGQVLTGYVLFCLVETCYALSLRPTWKNMCLRLVLYLAVLVLLTPTGLISTANAFGLLNLTLLLGNVLSAFLSYGRQRQPADLFLALALTLFAGCDYSLLAVALGHGSLYRIASFLVWPCYIPSQVMLVLLYIISVQSAVH